jgi:hypothetical protein
MEDSIAFEKFNTLIKALFFYIQWTSVPILWRASLQTDANFNLVPVSPRTLQKFNVRHDCSVRRTDRFYIES